jgi:hypothetical protein
MDSAKKVVFWDTMLSIIRADSTAMTSFQNGHKERNKKDYKVGRQKTQKRKCKRYRHRLEHEKRKTEIWSSESKIL